MLGGGLPTGRTPIDPMSIRPTPIPRRATEKEILAGSVLILLPPQDVLLMQHYITTTMCCFRRKCQITWQVSE